MPTFAAAYSRGTRCALVLAGVSAAACGDLPLDPAVAAENACATTAVVAVGQSVGGALSSGDCVRDGQLLLDRWSLALDQAMTLKIRVTSPAYDALVELHDAFGNVVAYADDFQPSGSRIIFDAAAGDYDVVVARVPGQTLEGDYQLTITEAPDCSPIGDLQLGRAVSGALEVDDCLIAWGGIADNWSLDLASERKLRLELSSPAWDGHLMIQDTRGDIFWGADTYGRDVATIETLVPAGAWTVVVGSPDEDSRGSYELKVDVAPPCTPGTDLALGETVTGELSPGDCLLDGWAPADSFALVIDRETQVDLLLKSPDFEPFLILRDDRGLDVATGYGMNQNGRASIQTSLAPGRYALLVVGFGSPAAGTYSLTSSEVDCGDPTRIVLETPITGTLQSGDCLRAGGAYQDVYELVLANDSPVQIDVKSGAFDAFVVLKDASGSVVEQNDDGGSSVDARIVRTLTAGTYEIVASAFAAGMTGAYEVSVRAPG